MTAQLLTRAGVPTISTTTLDKLPDDWRCPLVVKPRDGAGAVETMVVTSRDELASLSLTRSRASYVVQPLIDATAVSCFCVVSDDQLHVFPTASQRMSMKQPVKYLGGQMPLNVEFHQLVTDGITAIGARVGHFGIDIVVPHDGSPPQIVEINPRLTTAYLGYRQIITDNMAERILFPERFGPAIECNGRYVDFDTLGNTGGPSVSTMEALR